MELDNVFEEMKEEIRNNAGVDYFLIEGVQFFKLSSKLKSQHKKIKNALDKKESKLKDKSAITEIRGLIKDLEEAIKETEKIEEQIKNATNKQSKEKAKLDLKKLESKYQSIIKSMKKDKTRKALITLGVGLVIATSLSAIALYLSLGLGTDVGQAIGNLAYGSSYQDTNLAAVSRHAARKGIGAAQDISDKVAGGRMRQRDLVSTLSKVSGILSLPAIGAIIASPLMKKYSTSKQVKEATNVLKSLKEDEKAEEE